MDPVTPDPNDFVLPVGTVALRVAEDQPQYQAVTVLRTPDGRVVMQWRPTADELMHLNNARPVTLVLFTGPRGQQQPVQLFVAPLTDLQDPPRCGRCDAPLDDRGDVHGSSCCTIRLDDGRIVQVHDSICFLIDLNDVFV